MNQKLNSSLLVLPLLILLIVSCKMGGFGSKTSETNTAVNVANAAPPTREDGIKDFLTKAEELSKFTAAEHLNPKPKIKGKVAIVTESSSSYYSLDGFNEDGTDFNQKDLDSYGLTGSDLAVKVDEIDTLFRTKCSKGKQLGQYNTTDGRVLPAYGLDCKVEVVDYKAPAVIAQKTFTGKELDKDIKVTASTTERNAYMPSTEIETYFKSLRAK